MLHQQNFEYVFLVSEHSTKEIGVFLVLLEGLSYKKE
jgi:hypothetical protein